MRNPMFRRIAPFLAFAAALAAVQALATGCGAEYYLTQLTMSAYYSLPVLGLCLLMGYAGQISIGQAAFFAIGGYCAAVTTTGNLVPYQGKGALALLEKAGLLVERTNLYGMPILHLSPWAGLVLAIGLSAGVAFLIGIPVLKLKGHYLAMATLGFGIIIYRIVLGGKAFNAADGITDVPAFHLAGGIAVSGGMSERVMNYYFAFFLVLIVMLLFSNLIRSRMGRALAAIHGNEEAARSCGVDTAGTKLTVFILSAVCAALGGFFLTHYNGGIGPSEATVMKSIRYVAIVAAGGMASLWGTLILGIVLNFLSLRGYFGSYDDAVFGVILILIMLFAPDGIFKIRRIRQPRVETHG